MATFTSALRPRLIYVFGIADEAHKDCLKIGETTLPDDIGSASTEPNSDALNQAARARIDQYTKTAGISYELLHTELTLYIKGGSVCSFNDKEVHSVLERSGIKRKDFAGATEWYVCDLQTVKNAIAAIKEGRQSLSGSQISMKHTPFILRPEQREAVDRTLKQFHKGNKMLWNAKMRFGKTVCALHVAKEMKALRTIIITHRPVVDKSWFDDFQQIFYGDATWHYGSRTKGDSFSTLQKHVAKGEHSVYFASMQDMRGSKEVGGKFDKNNAVFSTEWDLVVVDEAHEGTQTELGKAVLEQLVSRQTKTILLSGTPFNLLDDCKEEEVFTWDYIMEQKAKIDWEITHLGDANPYATLPAISIYTYDLGSLLSEYSDEEKAFNFREFFRTREDGGFIHEADVIRFLDLLCRDDEDSLYPFSNDHFRDIFRHTLWVLPGVKAAKALSKLLANHSVFGVFHVVNVAGDGDEEEENRNALDLVNKAIGPDPDATYTITLSCGRLTTGVSVKPWTGVFMMAGAYSTSAAGYMQTIFRVQTPYTHNGKMKTDCYAFDFAPDRTLRVLAEVAKVSHKVGKQSEEDRQVLGDFLNYCPVISIDGSRMKLYDVNTMLGQLKRAQIERVVQGGFEDGALYNDELLKLTAVELKDFDDLKAVIGRTKAMPRPGDIDINRQGLSNEEYAEKKKLEDKKKKELSPEEQKRLDELKEKGNQRRDAISILRGISIRMPLMLYGAEIEDEDKELSIDNFVDLVDDQSWEEFMPRDVTKEVFQRFKRYYDPDVFREAGKRIREIARMADKFTIEERIGRITTLFATFRNPDKETVLTPWRVVNMHLADSLGGYCFMDETFAQPLDTPRQVVIKGVTDKVFHPKSRILEINSKSGLYPLYAAYSIYRARLREESEKYGEVNRAFALRLWDQTLEENILVVCKTPMARSITRRTLAGFRKTVVHAEYYPELIETITTKPDCVVNMLRSGKRFWKINDDETMKIDAVIGNPPYQIVDGGGNGAAAKPIYHEFVRTSVKMSPSFVSLIIPARWYAGGRGLDAFREEMLNSPHIDYIKDFPDAKDCFPTANISGGVCFIRWNKGCNMPGCQFVNHIAGVELSRNRRLDAHTSFIRYNAAVDIIDKVLRTAHIGLSKIVSCYMPFGIRSFERGTVKPSSSANLRLHSSKGVGYIDRTHVTASFEYIDTYKVAVGKAISGHLGEMDANGQCKLLATTKVLGPGEITTESYLVIGQCATKREAENLHKYVTTKFARFLLMMGLTSMNITRDRFLYVPMQDFKSSAEINWARSHSEIDQQLYAKYGLTDGEIDFIESLISSWQ